MPNFRLFGIGFGSPDSISKTTHVEDGYTFGNEFPVYTKTHTISMTTSTFPGTHVYTDNEYRVVSETATPNQATTVTDEDGTFILQNWGKSWSTTTNSNGETILNGGGVNTISWHDDFNFNWSWSTKEIHTTISEIGHGSKHYHDVDADDFDYGNFLDWKRQEAVATVTVTAAAAVSTSTLTPSISNSDSFLYAQETGLVERYFHLKATTTSDNNEYSSDISNAVAEVSSALAETSNEVSVANAGKVTYINGTTITIPGWAIAVMAIGCVGFLILGFGLVWLIARKRRAQQQQQQAAEEAYYNENIHGQHVVIENPFAQDQVVPHAGDVPPPSYSNELEAKGKYHKNEKN